MNIKKCMKVNIFSMLFIMIGFGFFIACLCSIINICIGNLLESSNHRTRVQPIEEEKENKYIVIINPGNNPMSLGIV